MTTMQLVQAIEENPAMYPPDMRRVAEAWRRAHARLQMALEDLESLSRWVDDGAAR